MREVLEHFGIGFLELVGCAGIVRIIVSFTIEGGIIRTFVVNYMRTLCG